MPALPKPVNKRARVRPAAEFREVHMPPAPEQPELPERDRPWSAQTLRFWESLGQSQIAAEFTATEWHLLALAAVIHEEVWTTGRTTRVENLMQILSRFPFTPKDRRSLHIQSLTGLEMEQRAVERQRGLEAEKVERRRATYGQLRAVDPSKA